ncbi:MAG: ATP-binding protein, partial [Planctomycetaceae bacterium]
ARESLSTLLAAQDEWFVLSARSVDEARALTHSGPVDLVLADLDAAGADCPAFIKEVAPLPVIVTAERDGLVGVIDALEAGAANYIPGHLRQDRLVGAIEVALSSALATSKRTRLLGWMEDCHSRFSIPTDLSMLSVAADRLQASLEMFGLCGPTETMHVRIAIDEALANAFYHGNLGVRSDLKETGEGDFERLAQQRLQESPYRDRRIEIEEHLTREEARFVIRDQGEGFDVRRVHNPTDDGRLTLSSGRGILMMRHFLDEVRFNKTGNEVTLVRRCAVKPARSIGKANQIPFQGRAGAQDAASAQQQELAPCR